MREAIGSTWLLQLIIIFMLIFVSFLALSLNFTKALKMRNDVISIIEHKSGATDGDDGAVNLINSYLKQNNYTTKRGCPVNSYGSTDLNSNTLTIVTDKNQKYYYCVSKVNTGTGIYPGRVHYEVSVFFKFNLPVIGDLFTFTAKGNSYEMINNIDNLISIKS